MLFPNGANANDVQARPSGRACSSHPDALVTKEDIRTDQQGLHIRHEVATWALAQRRRRRAAWHRVLFLTLSQHLVISPSVALPLNALGAFFRRFTVF
jgi:hypothetical protein